MATTSDVSIDCLLLTGTVAQMSPEDISAFMQQRPVMDNQSIDQMTEDALEHLPFLSSAAGLQNVLANQAATETLSAEDADAHLVVVNVF